MDGLTHLVVISLMLLCGAILAFSHLWRKGVIFRVDRMKCWMELMTGWSKESIPFEEMRERLIRRVGLEMYAAKDEWTRQQLKRAFKEFLAMWNEIVVEDKLGSQRQ